MGTENPRLMGKNELHRLQWTKRKFLRDAANWGKECRILLGKKSNKEWKSHQFLVRTSSECVIRRKKKLNPPPHKS